MLRVWFRSNDLSAFSESTATDRYVKLVFPKPDVEYPDPIDMRSLRRSMPGEDLPWVRTYTALYPNLEDGTMAIDFVIHGDTGVAGPWAVNAKEGDRLMVNGPGGGYRPDPTADWHLFVGDESAVPAITAALEVLPADALAKIVVLVEDSDHEFDLPRPSDSELVYVHRAQSDAPSALLDAVRALSWPEGRVHAFVHGEAEETMGLLRPYLIDERQIPREDLSISGYWRRGDAEEGFRAWKRTQRDEG